MAHTRARRARLHARRNSMRSKGTERKATLPPRSREQRKASCDMKASRAQHTQLSVPREPDKATAPRERERQSGTLADSPFNVLL